MKTNLIFPSLTPLARAFAPSAAIVLGLLALPLVPADAATVIYQDTFTRAAASGSLGTADTGGAWTTSTDTNRSWDINASNQGVMNVIATGSATALPSAYLAFTSLQLDDQASAEWTLNLRYPRTGQNWNVLSTNFADHNKAFGFVMASSSSDLVGAGNGYALVFSGSDTANNNTIKLVRFAGGLGSTNNVTPLISYTLSGTTPELPNSYLSLRVAFDGTTNGWQLFTAISTNDFQTDFSLVTNSAGIATDSTYTSSDLAYSGLLSNSRSNGGNDWVFDNLSMTVAAIPEPSILGLLLLGGVMLGSRRRR